ncbi:odorant receptor 4-like [Phymastichus coffea]|uniref:odorant receptor 4-like n=1 Tax=Phymastichus coffea TaxID=108790 RepID=UPI00273C5DA1|nr:odorant receptor 4-like [Phymastichus coffea]
MESELRKYEKYVGNVKVMLRYCGLWPVGNRVVSRVLAFIAFFTTLSAMLAVLNFCLHHANNIIVLTKGAGLAISLCTACLKVCIFIHHRQDLLYLHENLTARYLEDMKDVDRRHQLLTRVSLYSKFFLVGTVAAFGTIALYASISLIAWAKYGKYVRVFPVIYPFVGKPTGLLHWIFYMCEVTTGIFLSFVTAGVDCSFGMYSMQMCGQLRVLADKFQNLTCGGDYLIRIKDCIQRHHMLYTSKKKLENLFGIVTIWFAVTAAVVLCTLIFQITQAVKAKSTSLQLGLLALYFVLKCLQVFSFSVYGNAITVESKLCLDAVYKAQWTDLYNASWRNDILIILAQKPITLIAKGCMLIQLEMFAKIMNTSVSYFFLLQTLEEASQ